MTLRLIFPLVRSTRSKGREVVFRTGVVALAASLGVPAFAQMSPGYKLEVLSLRTDPRRLDGHLSWKGTGFYIDGSGRVMTAAHVVQGCRQLVVVKGDSRTAPSRMTVDTEADLAVLETGTTHGIAATFAADPIVGAGESVMTLDFTALQQLAPRSMILSNAFVKDLVERDGAGRGEFAMISSAAPGASGSPVMDDRGLIVGLVRERRSPEGPVAVGLVTHTVWAPSRARLTGFLDAAGVRYRQSAEPQLAPEQSRKDRIGSFTVGIYCG